MSLIFKKQVPVINKTLCWYILIIELPTLNIIEPE